MSVYALIPVMGSGDRLADRPAVLHPVAGVSLLEHGIARLRAAGVDHIVVAVPADRVGSVRRLLGATSTVVGAGVDRTETMTALLAVVGRDADVVLVHDAGRTFAPEPLIRAVIRAVRDGRAAVVPTLPVVDTIRTVAADGSLTGLLDRESLRVVQSPQGFRPDVLDKAYSAAVADGRAAGDAERVEGLGVPITVVAGVRAASAVPEPADQPRMADQ